VDDHQAAIARQVNVEVDGIDAEIAGAAKAVEAVSGQRSRAPR
jgi:hypothetical protein